MGVSGDNLARDQQHLLHSLHRRAAQQHAHVWARARGPCSTTTRVVNFSTPSPGCGMSWSVMAEKSWAWRRPDGPVGLCHQLRRQHQPAGDRTGRAPGRDLLPARQSLLFHLGRSRGQRIAFKTARYYLAPRRQARQVQGDWPGLGLPRYHAGRHVGHGHHLYWPMFEPRTPGFLHVESPYPYRFQPPPGTPANDPRTPGEQAADLLEAAILREGADTVALPRRTGASAGGVIVPPDDYWPRIRQICDRHDVLLVADEVITGFGRTGDWFGLSRYADRARHRYLRQGNHQRLFSAGRNWRQRSDCRSDRRRARQRNLDARLHLLWPPNRLRRGPGQPGDHRTRGAARTSRRGGASTIARTGSFAHRTRTSATCAGRIDGRRRTGS